MKPQIRINNLFLHHYSPDLVLRFVTKHWVLFLVGFLAFLFLINWPRIKRILLRPAFDATKEFLKDVFSKEIPASLSLSISEKAKEITNEFNGYVLDRERYFSYPLYAAWRKKILEFRERGENSFRQWKSPKELKSEFQKVLNLLNQSPELREKANLQYMKKQVEQHKEFFGTGKTAQLDANQKAAVVCDEYRTLILAGAGSGKTEVIVNRCGFLTKCKAISPEKILMITFTRKATGTMRERLRERHGIKSVEVSTIHSLALKIVAETTGKTPTAFEPDDDTQSRNTQRYVAGAVFKELIKTNQDFAWKVMNYQLYYHEAPKEPHSFKTREEWEEYVAGLGEYKTLTNDLVKSHEEKIICDLFFTWGIKVDYEHPYKYDMADKTHRQYFPDFYLPEYDVYVEHYGVDRNMNPPPWFTDAEKKGYIERMKFKDYLHKVKGTKIIHTFSYQCREGILAEELLAELQKFGISPKKEKLDFREFVGGDEEYAISRSLINFLNLFKVGNYSLEEMNRSTTNPKEKLFLNIFEVYYHAYQKRAKELGRCDFSDLIRDAIRGIKENGIPPKFQYENIIVDEFQDTGRGAIQLINLMAERIPNCSLYFVGDDWQSIYNFAGSDISLITRFEELYEGGCVLEMGTNYRSAPNVVELGKEWILRNQSQRPKSVKSNQGKKQSNGFFDSEPECRKAIVNLMARNKKATVFILGRYRNDIKFPWLDKLIKEYPDKAIQAMTIHKAKGLEADWAIIVPPKKWGFPSRLKDDEVLRLVCNRGEGYDSAEERRLMYVAITRAKDQVFFLMPGKKEGQKVPTFMEELVPLVKKINFKRN